MKQPIDAVVTWVNGDDPVHRQKREAYLASLGKVPSIASANRFQESGEFIYCITSLLKFAPWLRRIHIVTDEQTPDFLTEVTASGLQDRIVVVDHRTVFRGFEDCLPTFNIRSIISVLWRIPDLAERFIFLNDDFLLAQPLMPEDFFRDDKMVVRGRWERLPWLRIDQRLIRRLGGAKRTDSLKRPGNRDAQARSAELAGCEQQYFRVPHNPHPLLRSVIEQWVSEHPEPFARNLRFRLRSGEQFLMDSLATHLALLSGRAVVDNRLKTLRLRMDALSLRGFRRRVWWSQVRGNRGFACLQSLEQATPEVRATAMDWMAQTIGPLSEQLRHHASK